MDSAEGRSILRVIRSTDNIIHVHTPGAAPISKTERASLLSAYDSHLSDLTREVKPETFVRDPAGNDKGCAKAWLDAYFDNKVIKKLQVFLRVVRERVDVIACTSSDVSSRRNACYVVWYGGKTACTLLHHACLMVSTLLALSRPPSDMHALATRAVAAMTEAGFMSAVSAAVTAMVSTAALLRSDIDKRELLGPTFDITEASAQSDGQAGLTALAVCQYLLTVTEAQFHRVLDAGKDSKGPELLGSSSTLPSEALQAFDALVDSQLLAAAATALVDSPPVDEIATLPEAVRNSIRYGIRHACASTATAMFSLSQMQNSLAKLGGKGRQLSAGLLRAARHEAVQRLQVALLDQLAAHAGMAAGLEEWEGGSGLQEGGDGARQAPECGWEGSSGTWWLAREEEAQGQLLGLDPYGGDASRACDQETRSKTAGWLEDYHCHIVHVTVQDWLSVDPAKAAAAGVPAAPPPLLVARLAARAAEALCRLCRGQGLGGAYAPAPEWQFALSTGLVYAMFGELPSLQEATARACIAFRLEAAGWLVALMSDATAAAMGRLPSTKVPQRVRSLLAAGTLKDDSPAQALDEVLQYLMQLSYEHRAGARPALVLPITPDVMRRHMSRCGLAASLDHILRLTYSAQDAGDTLVAMFLGRTGTEWSIALGAGLVPLLPPTGGPGSGAQADGGGSIGGGGRGEGNIQLGLLFTLSKRAAMLARALEMVSGAGGAGKGGQGEGQGLDRKQVVDWAADVLALLQAAVHSIEDEVKGRVEAAGREAAAGRGAAWDAEAACLDEVHEALALAVRAASNLAAPLVWELAADIAAAAGEVAAREPAVQLSSVQELGLSTVCDVLGCTVHCWRDPLLPPAQLMACQPHRLLAAACALAAALPGSTVPNSEKLEWSRKRLCVIVPSLLLVMAAHEALSGQVREWLRPPPAAASSSCAGDSGSGAELGACAGCLEAPVRSFAKWALRHVPFEHGMYALALLKIAAGAAGGTEGQAGADGGFRQFAAVVHKHTWSRSRNTNQDSFTEVSMPDGSRPTALLAEELGGAPLPPPPPPVAPSGALPPLLVLPPSRQGALPWLRVCGNPWCGNFAERCEGALPLKQCSGCRAVRYCCADCQRGHWRSGHKAECKLMGTEAGN